MNRDIDLKKLWNKQEAPVPDVKELLQKAGNFKRRNLRKLILANIISLATSAFIIFIWIYFQPEMITTKIGIVLVILAMVVFMAVYNQMIPLLTETGFDITNAQYLQQLLKLKEKQLFLQNRMMAVYFILLSSGLCLYMYEYASRMSILWAIFSYGITLLWMAINWFYFLPRTIKKQKKKINEIIENLEKVRDQLSI